MPSVEKIFLNSYGASTAVLKTLFVVYMQATCNTKGFFVTDKIDTF